MKWYLKVLQQYADFGGRARRKEFWYFVLFNFIAVIVAVIIDTIAGWKITISDSGMPNYGPCYLTYAVAAFLPALAAGVRRLHDLGKSGWWLLISLIPLAGGIWLIVLLCTDGQSGQNRYGANPKSAKPFFSVRRREKSIALAFIVGAAAALIGSASNWIKYDSFTMQPFWFWLIPVLSITLTLLFGVFYRPVGNSDKTAKRQNTAFVLLAISALIPAIRGILALNHISANNIIWLLANSALLALAALLLLKSEQKNIRLASIFTILFSALSVVMQLVMSLKYHYTDPFGIILTVPMILFAAHYLRGKAAAAEEEEPAELSPEQALQYQADETVVYQPSSQPPVAGSPRGGSGKGMGWKIFGLVVSIGLIIGGLSGELVLRGTESSGALVAVGILFLIGDIISIVNHNKNSNSKRKQEYEQQLAAGAISSVELAAPATIRVVRDSSIVGAIVPYKVFLNHDFVGKINNGKTLDIQTSVSHNIITVFVQDNAFAGDFTTDLEAGGYAEVHVKAGMFVKR